MERKAKVELFEQIRREYEFGAGTVLGIARKLGVHRRIVSNGAKCQSNADVKVS
jgi:ActR/RegA family two-component response regulator